MNLHEMKKQYDDYKTIKTEAEALEAVKQDGHSLQYVQNQTEEICLEAVKQEGYALQYVNPIIFKNLKTEMTIAEIEKQLGYSIKIIK